MLECKLTEEFDDCNFKVKVGNEKEIEVLYDDISYVNDEGFLEEVLDIASDILDAEELWNVTVTYDALNEIIYTDLG